jgi:hypothetical protein
VRTSFVWNIHLLHHHGHLNVFCSYPMTMRFVRGLEQVLIDKDTRRQMT